MVRNEITSLVLYHIWKFVYQWSFPTWYRCFCGTLSGFDSVVSSQKFCKTPHELVGVSGRKLCWSRVLVIQRSFQKFSSVPVRKQKRFIGNTKFQSSDITEKLVRVCEDTLFLPENQTIYWKQPYHKFNFLFLWETLNIKTEGFQTWNPSVLMFKVSHKNPHHYLCIPFNCYFISYINSYSSSSPMTLNCENPYSRAPCW